MSLNAKSVEAARLRSKDYKKYDEKGLYLLVKANGSKYWRLRYRFEGKEKLLALGVYPKISLSKAREKQGNAFKLLDKDIDPSAYKKQKNDEKKLKNKNTFEAVAREWYGEEKKRWTDHHATRVIGSMEKELFPKLGK